MIPLFKTQERADLNTAYSEGMRVPVVCNWISPPGTLAPEDEAIEAKLSDVGQVFFPYWERDTVTSDFDNHPIVQQYIQFEIEVARDVSALEIRDILMSRLSAVDAGALNFDELSGTPEAIKDIREGTSGPAFSGFGAGVTVATVSIAIIAGVAVYLVMRYTR